MSKNISEYLQLIHSKGHETFLAKNPDAVLIQQSNPQSIDPRNEYRSTLKMQIDPQTQEVRVVPPPPSPLDNVYPLCKSDRNSFDSKILVGRTETNDIVVSHLTVSKHHAFFKFDLDAGRTILTDTGSTNGTRLNGQVLPAREPRYLSDGDQVSFGDIQFLYCSPVAFLELLTSLSALR